jgi:hypothetical protein
MNKNYSKWYEDAKKQTPETLSGFLQELASYNHDYESCIHFVAASAIAGAHAANSKVGITGFQAGGVMWEFIRNWSYTKNKTGLQIIDFDNLLFPQYESRFTITLTETLWQCVRKEAKSLLSEKADACPEVIKHWQSIVDGEIPFGLKIKD